MLPWLYIIADYLGTFQEIDIAGVSMLACYAFIAFIDINTGFIISQWAKHHEIECASLYDVGFDIDMMMPHDIYLYTLNATKKYMLPGNKKQ